MLVERSHGHYIMYTVCLFIISSFSFSLKIITCGPFTPIGSLSEAKRLLALAVTVMRFKWEKSGDGIERFEDQEGSDLYGMGATWGNQHY